MYFPVVSFQKLLNFPIGLFQKMFNVSSEYSFKAGVTYAIYSTFTPHFMCSKYFDECFMDKNLFHTSLTKFNKLSKRRKCTFLITQSINRTWNKHKFFLHSLPLYLRFFFSTFIYGGSFDVCSCTIFLTRSQNNVLWIACAEQLRNSVLLRFQSTLKKWKF